MEIKSVSIFGVSEKGIGLLRLMTGMDLILFIETGKTFQLVETDDEAKSF